MEALKLWQEYRGAVALLLTDLVMPGGMSGQELAAAFAARNSRSSRSFISAATARTLPARIFNYSREKRLSKSRMARSTSLKPSASVWMGERDFRKAWMGPEFDGLKSKQPAEKPNESPAWTRCGEENGGACDIGKFVVAVVGQCRQRLRKKGGPGVNTISLGLTHLMPPWCLRRPSRQGSACPQLWNLCSSV